MKQMFSTCFSYRRERANMSFCLPLGFSLAYRVWQGSSIMKINLS